MWNSYNWYKNEHEGKHSRGHRGQVGYRGKLPVYLPYFMLGGANGPAGILSCGSCLSTVTCLQRTTDKRQEMLHVWRRRKESLIFLQLNKYKFASFSTLKYTIWFSLTCDCEQIWYHDSYGVFVCLFHIILYYRSLCYREQYHVIDTIIFGG